MFKDINGFIRNDYFGIEFCRARPVHALRYAKKYFKNKRIKAIEVGVHKGYGARDIMKYLNVKKLVLIDPYKAYEDGNYKKNQKEMSDMKTKTEKKLKKYGEIRWIIENSDSAYEELEREDNFYDYIYIDGLHTYEQVKRDLYNYWELLAKGGIITGDNITSPMFSKGIFKAVSEFCVENKLDCIITRKDWIIIK